MTDVPGTARLSGWTPERPQGPDSDPARTFTLALRTGSWATETFLLSVHRPVVVELAPADGVDVLLRIHDGLPAVPRDRGPDEVALLEVCDATGPPRLSLRPGVEAVRTDDVRLGDDWELRVEGQRGRSLHLYARRGAPYPSDAVLEDLADVR